MYTQEQAAEILPVFAAFKPQELSKKTGIYLNTVKYWYQQGRIPVQHLRTVQEATGYELEQLVPKN